MAAALFVGVVGTGVQAIVQEDAKAKAAYQAKWAAYGAAWERRYRAQHGAGYVSPHDKVVLKAAKEWEIRYRAMYPSPRRTREEQETRITLMWSGSRSFACKPS